VLWSAQANAEEKGLDVDALFVTQAHVGKNLVMKRSMARGRGRGSRIEKPFSQITIVVKQDAERLEALENRKKQARNLSPERRRTETKAAGATA
jgi:large subunit ribosomal protein L22